MVNKFYIDTCIYRDFYENRYSLNKKPLGELASKLFSKIINDKDIILYSDLIIYELKIDYEINEMLNILFILKILKKVDILNEDYKKAKEISKNINLPKGDVLHAIIASKNNAILVSQDKHMQKLKDIVNVKRPVEIV